MTVAYTTCDKGCARWNKRFKRCPKGAPAASTNAELCNLFQPKSQQRDE